MSLNYVDLAILVIYVAGTVALGLWVGRKSGNTEEFMAAGRKLPGWAVGLSIFGTYVSSISFLALPGSAFSGNWNGFVFSLAIPPTAWIAVRYFVPFYRAHNTLSSYEHLERRFGPWARTYTVICYLLTQLARMGIIMYLLAMTLAQLTGVPMWLLICVTGAVVIVYTMFGGIEAVIWTDVVQSIVLMTGAAACVAVLMLGMPEGPGQLFDIAVEHHKFSLGSFGPSLAESTFWVVLIYGVFVNLQNFGIDQSYVQRYQTARSDKEANRSVWLGALLYIPISALFFFIGTGLFAFYTAQPDILPADVAAKGDRVFPFFIVHQLPPGLSGLVIAAIVAAAQSTISSSINCSATLLLCDIYRRYIRPLASERESMWVLWTMSLLVGIGGTAVALAMLRVEQGALEAWWKMAGIFSGGMLGLFLLGLISRRATSPAAATGVVIGLLVIMWMILPAVVDVPEPFRNPMHSYMTIVVGTLTIFLVGLLVSRFTKKPTDYLDSESVLVD